jgi:hypothetical protein
VGEFWLSACPSAELCSQRISSQLDVSQNRSKVHMATDIAVKRTKMTDLIVVHSPRINFMGCVVAPLDLDQTVTEKPTANLLQQTDGATPGYRYGRITVPSRPARPRHPPFSESATIRSERAL